ncbi:MAG TPA: BadF/BadG/BcrA/BcrD ATPase family protein, partial [Caldilineaceae bacterium]|nr:BadF/BadG/BcrA/BcrD ATPase family protein [Caldilineaceae bacterium]
TLVAILDEQGHVLATGVGGPSNYDDVGAAVAQQNLAQAVEAARRAAHLDAQPFAAAFLGMAGVVSPQDRQVIHQIAQALHLAAPDRTGVDHDCRIALAGGLTGRPGIVQIAGTGSSTFGMNAAGESWRSGGWGHLLADEGSGYWLGMQAMIAAVRSYDGRIPPSSLEERVLAALGLGDMNEIMHRLYVEQLSRSEVARLGLLVIDAASAGDPYANTLIHRGCEEMADCVLAVARRLGLDGRPCELALVGGIFQAGAIVLQPFTDAVQARLPHCRLTLAELPPVLGAGVLALQMLGIPIDEQVFAALQADARAQAGASLG